MVLSLELPATLSLEEFLQLPETKPASEYIEGKIHQKPMPQGKHSRLQTRFPAVINEVGEPQQLASAFTELRVTFGNRSIVPDISVFEWSRIPLDANGEIENKIEIAPDWVIEILSPEQSPTRVIDKIVFCLKNGSQLGWFIEPQERLIMVFTPNQLPTTMEGEDSLPVLSVLTDWQLSVADVFGLLSFRGNQ
ncbi:Uma2 family endonuclease [Argonema antarcticum]|uniref:Uma2 family endonuclease n=1 Tax=Argonema antarcticum TaxID=2942763 RepID=UPI002010CD81|nr:Uma2 family endonuclease [Argonema antarcticum]MCL1471733.1 Uma2 family endonuclease [Argonema antarcticum A004/B2]